jgi:hypothetical protein
MSQPTDNPDAVELYFAAQDFLVLLEKHQTLVLKHRTGTRLETLRRHLMDLQSEMSGLFEPRHDGQPIPNPRSKRLAKMTPEEQAEAFKPMKDFCESLAEQAEIYNRTAPKRIPNN